MLPLGSVNISGCRIVTFCDASFKNLPDEGSQGGFIIFLCDKEGNSSPIHWQSKKIKRNVKSTLAAECLALQEAAETAFYTKTILCEILNLNQRDIKIECYTDNKSLVDSVHSSKTLQDKKLILDMAIVKEMLQKKEIACINWIETSKQLADSLTKNGASSAKLQDVICEGKVQL